MTVLFALAEAVRDCDSWAEVTGPDQVPEPTSSGEHPLLQFERPRHRAGEGWTMDVAQRIGSRWRIWRTMTEGRNLNEDFRVQLSIAQRLNALVDGRAWCVVGCVPATEKVFYYSGLRELLEAAMRKATAK